MIAATVLMVVGAMLGWIGLRQLQRADELREAGGVQLMVGGIMVLVGILLALTAVLRLEASPV